MTNGLYIPYTGLTDERYTWRYELQHSFWHEPYVLQQYRANRDSNLWRSTREVEKLCEYILYLEGQCGLVEGAKTMSEILAVYCDYCDGNLSSTHAYPKYSLRLIESQIPIELPAEDGSNTTPELNGIKNFCNISCLTFWAQPLIVDPVENTGVSHGE